jgi:hypothetical protein
MKASEELKKARKRLQRARETYTRACHAKSKAEMRWARARVKMDELNGLVRMMEAQQAAEARGA